MRYFYDLKRKYVEMYHNEIYSETPVSIFERNLIKQYAIGYGKRMRKVLLLYSANAITKSGDRRKKPTFVSQVVARKSCAEIAVANGINQGQLYQWVQKCKTKGQYGLAEIKKATKQEATNEKYKSSTAYKIRT